VYTVKQLSKMASISPRTLHYYDQIGLLLPQATGENGYRYYGEESLLRLQQILFYKELGLRLEEIGAVLDQPGFDLLQALNAHRRALQERVQRLNTLIQTVDQTMSYLRGEIEMSEKDLYSGFDEEQQKRYAEEAQQRWGDTAATSQRRWEAYSRDEKNNILAEGKEISTNLAAHMDKGPQDADVQYWIDRQFKYFNRYFYDCTLDIFEGLGHMYTEDPRFEANYENIRPGMAAFMEKAMSYYVQVQRGK
jgi:DNA-binding transcriptional MerR regulator